jgi:hypothetical protein
MMGGGGGENYLWIGICFENFMLSSLGILDLHFGTVSTSSFFVVSIILS